MAKNTSKTGPSLKQRIDASLTRRAKGTEGAIPAVGLCFPEFISQAEIVHVLSLRAQLSVINDELKRAQSDLFYKLEEEAIVEMGFYTCVGRNQQVTIIENDSGLEL